MGYKGVGVWRESYKSDSGNLNAHFQPEFDPGYHESGHASREDLAWVIDQIDPDVVIPVHTMRREWFEENFGGVVHMDEGMAGDF
jgi:ribonuclease J